jgi:hypothetical protein
VAEYSEANYSGGEPCAQLSVMPTAQLFWRSGNPMDSSRFSRFGRTLALLTEADGEALLMWYLEAFPAKTSAVQASAQVWPANKADCGGKCSGWFAKYDPATCSWKTPQNSLVEGSTESVGTWPRAGTICGGHAFQVPAPARLSGGIAYGLLPTHTASDAKRASNGTSRNRRVCNGLTLTDWLRLNFGQVRLKPSFTEWMMLWPEGWTALDPVATDKFQQWQQQHGDPSQSDASAKASP